MLNGLVMIRWSVYKISMSLGPNIDPGSEQILCPFDLLDISSTKSDYYNGEWSTSEYFFRPLYKNHPFIYLLICNITFISGQQWDAGDEVVLRLEWGENEEEKKYVVPGNTTAEVGMTINTFNLIVRDDKLSAFISHTSANTHTITSDKAKTNFNIYAQEPYIETE